MHDVPHSEALAFLAEPQICDDASWKTNRLNPGLTTLECGLVKQDGSRAGLSVQLQFSRSQKTKIVSFKFTVFKLNLGAHQRVYQLQIGAVARAPTNWHQMVHEHVGDLRIEGKQEWLSWSFQQALDYFCERANISFTPPLVDPEDFQLQP